jgi:hypothetical protein
MQAIQSAPQVLHPHVSTLLEGQEWSYWRRKLDGLSYREDAMQQARSGFQGAEFSKNAPAARPSHSPDAPAAAWTTGGAAAPCGAMA